MHAVVSSSPQVFRPASDCHPSRHYHSCRSRSWVRHSHSPHTLDGKLSWGFVWQLSRVLGDTSLSGYPYRPSIWNSIRTFRKSSPTCWSCLPCKIMYLPTSFNLHLCKFLRTYLLNARVIKKKDLWLYFCHF